MLSIFIAGLKKQSGKTLLSAGLAGTMQSLSYATSYYKPIQTGSNLLNNDEEFIKKFDSNIKTLTTYRFSSPSSPLISAYEEGIKKIDKSKIFTDFRTNAQMSECRIVEGTNSISSPIDTKLTECGIISALELPVILVLNPITCKMEDVISGINYIYSNKIKLIGAVINEYNENSQNLEHKYYPQLVKEYTGAHILGCLPHYDDFENLNAGVLIADTLNRLNIEGIFGLKIAKLA